MRKSPFSKSEDLDICTHVMNWTANDSLNLKNHLERLSIKDKKPNQVYNRWKTLLKTNPRAKNALARFKALKEGAKFHPERTKQPDENRLQKAATKFREHHDNLNEGKKVKQEIIEKSQDMVGLFGKSPKSIEMEGMKYDKNSGIFTAEKITITFFFLICFGF